MEEATASEARPAGLPSRAFARAVTALAPVVVAAWIAAAVLALLALPPVGQGGALGGIEPSGARAGAVEARSAQLFGAPLISRALVVQRDPRGLSPAAQLRALERARAGRDPALPALRGVLPLVNARGLVPASRETGTTAISYLFFAPDSSIADQDAAAHAFASRAAGRPADALVGVTGVVPARIAQWDAISGALPWLTLVTVLLIAAVVGLRFRALGAPVVALAAAGIAYVVSTRAVGWLDERSSLSVPQEAEPVMVVLLLGIVTDYAIFYLEATREQQARGLGRWASARVAAAATTPIVFTAGLLVAASTAALVLGRSDFFRAFGPGLALTALVSMAVAVTFVPAALALAGRAAFWPRGAGSGAPPDGPSPPGRLARLATARPVALVAVLACAALGVAAAGGLRDARLAVPLMSDLPGGSEVARAQAAASAGMAPGVVAPTEVLVEGGGVGSQAAALGRLRALLAREPGVAAVVGPGSDVGRWPPGVLVTRDGRAARYAVVLSVDPLGADGLHAARRLRGDLPALLRRAGLPGARADVAGDSALGAETIDGMLADLARVAGAALLAAFVVLAVFLRSLLAPLVLLAASVLALVVSLGLTAPVFQEHLGYDALSWYVPFTAAVLLIALGSDYNVFVAGRIWQQAPAAKTARGDRARGAGLREGARRGRGRAGPELRRAGHRPAALLPRARVRDGVRGADRDVPRAPDPRPGAAGARAPAGAPGRRPARPPRSGRVADLPGAVGDPADPGRPRVMRLQQRDRVGRARLGDDADEPAAHVEHVPHLARIDRAEPRHEREDARHRQRRLDRVADAAVQAQEVRQPSAGDVGQAVHGDVAAQQVERRADVDDGRREQRIGDGGTLELGRAVVVAQLGQRAPRQRVAVGVQAAGRQADQRVAGRDGRAGDDRVEGHDAEARRAEVEAVRRRVPADELGQDRQLAAGDLHAGGLRSGLQPARDRRRRLGVGLLDGEVVEHGERLGADAHDVVDVHRDAVDADRVQPPGLLGDDELGPDAVRADRDPERVGDAQHARVVAGEVHDARGASRLDRAQDADEGVDGAVRGGDVDAGRGVGVRVGHAAILARAARPRPPPARRGTRRRARASGRARPGG